MESSSAIGSLSALAHAGRLAIFQLLVRRAPEAVAAGEIALAVGVRGSTLSNQVAELERAGLVHSERRGRSILYRADTERMGALIGFLAMDCCRGRPEACLPAMGEAGRTSPRRREGITTMNETAAVARRPYTVLFLCTGNSARSIFAEAIVNRVAPNGFVGFSAGANPRGDLHPQAARLLRSLNFDVSGFRSKSWDTFAKAGAPEIDFVFTVCDQAANEPCPSWPGQPMSAHWGVADPAAATGNETERALAFTEAYRVLFNRISAFTSLPIASLDTLSLQKDLDAIGRQRPATTDRSALPQTA